ncbi:uncharacterized protein TNCV_4098911 [Trichonephila clavipes]|nr:uncharacterized protein TNCV_4098911 [Trichonephila clavipes]
MVRTVTLVHGPTLKSAAIYGRVAHLSRLMTRSCMIFFRPQRCCRFDVLPDSRYSRYTREMVARENPNFIITSEMLCPISRAPTVTPRSNSLCDECVRNLSTNLLRCLSGEYKFAFISNQLQKEVWDI